MKGRAFAWRGFDPDPPSMSFHDALAQGKANPASIVGSDAVQSLEHFEDALPELGVESDAVVFDSEVPMRTLSLSAHAHLAGTFVGPKFDRVRE